MYLKVEAIRQQPKTGYKNMKSYEFNTSKEVSVKVSLHEIFSGVGGLCFKFLRTEVDCFGENPKIVSAKHVVISSDNGTTDFRFENLILNAYAQQSRRHAKALLSGSVQDANEEYAGVHELQSLINALRGDTFITSKIMEITK